jgi:predicted alpha/beta hydrolase family esterase
MLGVSAPPVVLVLPGLGGSGPAHWQSLWEARYGYRRVEQEEWDRPQRVRWIEALEIAVGAAAGPAILVAHSLGCALVAHWAAASGDPRRVAAALLVAPADVESAAHTPAEARAFAPLPMARLPFRSAVVASASDPYADIGRARSFAQGWGARFVDVGDAGHINVDAGFGPWPAGHALLEGLIRDATGAP